MAQNRPTMADIARLSGVSQSTVSLVLNKKGNGTIPAETVTRVMEAARELHYNKSARSPGRPRSDGGQVLVLVSDLTNPYYSFIIHELELAAASSGLWLLCCNTYHRKDREGDFLEMALRGNYRAAIFLYPPDDPENVNRVSRLLPVIAICDRNSACQIDLIELNNFQAGRIAAEHLISLGHRKIAVLSSNPRRSLSRSNRIDGIRRQMEESGLSEGLSVFVPDQEELREGISNNMNYNIGYALAQRPELRSGEYTAFIAINDMIAMGAIDGFSSWGAHFPENYSLVGFDNLLYTGVSRISLTTVDHHPDLLAQAAIDLLKHRTGHSMDTALLSSARFKVECPPQLVVRSSTAPL